MAGEISWQKSSFSGGDLNQDCVEIARSSGLIAIRESDVPHVILTTTTRHLRDLIRSVKQGAIDHSI
ncbi:MULTISPECIES: DUF397 domain-containing protein [Streptomyces]|uniref:DUF397 domain-containing protein n=1 Tax=Streptomyces luteosporeus TaxID=173856 RepID=A0ABP6FY70_9ACTN